MYVGMLERGDGKFIGGEDYLFPETTEWPIQRGKVTQDETRQY
jgi:hypothetical protein